LCFSASASACFRVNDNGGDDGVATPTCEDGSGVTGGACGAVWAFGSGVELESGGDCGIGAEGKVEARTVGPLGSWPYTKGDTNIATAINMRFIESNAPVLFKSGSQLALHNICHQGDSKVLR